MSGKILARALAVIMALMLAACGADDNSSPLSGIGSGGGGGEPDSEAPTVAIGSVDLLSDRLQIGSAGTGTATLSALVRTPGGVAAADQVVQFTVSPDSNATLNVMDGGVTNASGIASATLSANPDRRNRTVTVTARIGSQQAQLNVAVTGTSIAISGPQTIALNEATSYSARLTDSAGTPIAGQLVQFSSSLNNSISPSSRTTNADGLAAFELTGTSSGQTDFITATAYSGASQVSTQVAVDISGDVFRFESPAANAEFELNTPEDIAIRWEEGGAPVADGTQVQFSATRGTLTPADGIVTTSGGLATISIASNNAGFSSVSATPVAGGPTASRAFEFVSTTPDSISLQADRTQVSTGQSATVTATVRDLNNNLVKNALVTFSLDDVTSGTLSNGSAVTNSQGRAQVTYTASNTTSGESGVTVTARVTSTIADSIDLTVGGEPLRIVMGTGNQIEVPNNTTYTQPWTVAVTDASMNAQANRTVELSAVSTRYFKGFYAKDTNDNWAPFYTVDEGCLAEDVNNNGILDDGEDLNGNGQLDPTNSVALPQPGTLRTDENGIVNFGISYPKDQCSWVEIKLTATTSVQGTESSTSRKFVLPCVATDLESPAPPGTAETVVVGGQTILAVTSPYGWANSCANPN